MAAKSSQSTFTGFLMTPSGDDQRQHASPSGGQPGTLYEGARRGKSPSAAKNAADDSTARLWRLDSGGGHVF